MACYVSARRHGRARCCAVAALLLGAGCATDFSREQLAAEYFNLGTGYLELGEPQQAAGYFRRGLELRPEAWPELTGGVTALRCADFMAVPYYAWGHRGVGEMNVWFERIPAQNGRRRE